MTAFKLLCNQDIKEDMKLVFLPIGGLGHDDKTIKEKLNKLSKIKIGFEPKVVLVDGDEAGKHFQELCIKENLTNKVKVEVLEPKKDLEIKFSENDNLIYEKKSSKSKIVNEIENLFSPEDIEKYLDILKSKSVKKSSLFKKMILEEDNKPNEETIDNFSELLKYLYAL